MTIFRCFSIRNRNDLKKKKDIAEERIPKKRCEYKYE